MAAAVNFWKGYKYLRSFGTEIKTDSDGAASYILGMGLYVPAVKKSEKEPVQGVIIFRKGYYGEGEPE